MVRGSVAAAEAAMKAGAKRFVYVSSIAALDTRGPAPLEDSLATDAAPGARNVYAREDRSGEGARRDAQGARAPSSSRGRASSSARHVMQHSGLGYWARDNHCIGWGAGDHPLPLVWVDDVAAALAAIAAFEDRARRASPRSRSDRPAHRPGVVAELARSTGRDLVFHRDRSRSPRRSRSASGS